MTHRYTTLAEALAAVDAGAGPKGSRIVVSWAWWDALSEAGRLENLAVGEEKVLQLSTIGREAGDQLIRFTLQCDILSHEITAETSTFFFKAEK